MYCIYMFMYVSLIVKVDHSVSLSLSPPLTPSLPPLPSLLPLFPAPSLPNSPPSLLLSPLRVLQVVSHYQ